MIEGYGAISGAGSIPGTSDQWIRIRDAKNIWIQWIRIRNTGLLIKYSTS